MTACRGSRNWTYHILSPLSLYLTSYMKDTCGHWGLEGLVCDHIITSSHHLIISSSHHLIITSSHHHIITSSHHHIITSSHHHIITSSHHHIITSSHHHIITSSHTDTASHTDPCKPHCPYVSLIQLVRESE
jgi:hypothetical protein